MFNLEKSITGWRRQMLAAGVKSPVPLDELENHLRDEITQQMKSGRTEAEAFEQAVQKIGQANAVQREFAKTGAVPAARWQRWKTALLRFLGIPLPPPDLLGDGAQEILRLGSQEALSFHHDFIGTEHVLLALLDSESAVVTGVLQNLGVRREIVRSEIEKLIGGGVDRPINHTPPCTPRVKKALQFAGAEARAMHQAQVGAEHIFLGLLREGGGVAAIILKSLGVNSQSARAEVLRRLGGNQRGI